MKYLTQNEIAIAAGVAAPDREELSAFDRHLDLQTVLGYGLPVKLIFLKSRGVIIAREELHGMLDGLKIDEHAKPTHLLISNFDRLRDIEYRADRAIQQYMFYLNMSAEYREERIRALLQEVEQEEQRLTSQEV